MKQILDSWQTYLYACGKSPHTIRNYLSDARQFVDCLKAKDVDPLNLDRHGALVYLSMLVKTYTSKATIMRKRDAVKMLYRFMAIERVVSGNPFLNIPRMKVERELPKFLTQDETATLLDTVAPNPDLQKPVFGRQKFARRGEAAFLAVRDRALLEVLYSTGLRAQETANLDWQDIDFKTAFVRVNFGKGGRDRVVPLTETAIDALWHWAKLYREHFDREPAKTNPVFPSRRDMRITTRSIQRAVNLRLKLAGIETTMSTHGLRHSFATHLMQNGAGIIDIGKMLGHTSLSNTQKYTHVTLADARNDYDKAHPRA